jgi:hypothetical protein
MLFIKQTTPKAPIPLYNTMQVQVQRFHHVLLVLFWAPGSSAVEVLAIAVFVILSFTISPVAPCHTSFLSGRGTVIVCGMRTTKVACCGQLLD